MISQQKFGNDVLPVNNKILIWYLSDNPILYTPIPNYLESKSIPYQKR